MPSKRVLDEYGRNWDLTEEDGELYERAEEGGTYPLALMRKEQGWGWWSCYQAQEDWLKGCGVPMPDHKTLFGLDEANDADLRRWLVEFGGYIAWLEAQLGILEGRRSALKQAYEAAVTVRSSGLEEKTERAKEASLLAGNRDLKETKRLLIEQDTLLATAKGLKDAYVRCWETCSRVITSRTAEQEATTRRHP